MGWMETRNASKAKNRQFKSQKNTTKKYAKLIKKHEKNDGTKDSEMMSPELRDAYAHFSDGSNNKTKFNSKIGSYSGMDTPGTSSSKEQKVKAKDGATKINEDGTVVAYASDKLRSTTKFKLGRRNK